VSQMMILPEMKEFSKVEDEKFHIFIHLSDILFSLVTEYVEVKNVLRTDPFDEEMKEKFLFY
jgi:hypothetical protein